MNKIKAITALVLALILLFSLSTALADSTSSAKSPIDFSSMSVDDLVALKDQVNLAIWNSKDWKEVTIPQGVWQVGKDIPSGHWTIKPTVGHAAYLNWCEKLNEQKAGVDYSGFSYDEAITDEKYPTFDKNKDKSQIDWELTDGSYVIIDVSSVVFMPYDGKPAFTFN